MAEYRLNPITVKQICSESTLSVYKNLLNSKCIPNGNCIITAFTFYYERKYFGVCRSHPFGPSPSPSFHYCCQSDNELKDHPFRYHCHPRNHQNPFKFVKINGYQLV